MGAASAPRSTTSTTRRVLFDQTEVDGHLFGPSQLGSTDKLFGAKSEPAILYKQLTGKELTEGGATDGSYWGLLGLYSRAAGGRPAADAPTRSRRARSACRRRGAPDFPVGYTSLPRRARRHARRPRPHRRSTTPARSTGRATVTSPSDGKRGTYLETYGGKRFRNGEWPAEDPPIYPGS